MFKPEPDNWTKIIDDLSDASKVALEMLRNADDDFSRLPKPVAHFLRVDGAQGTFDNGGFVYFFESDWEGQPSYDEFIAAYAAIGCAAQAENLSRIVSTFPFPNPHLHQELRSEYINERFNEKSSEVDGWGDDLCGDYDVYVKLHAYYKKHAGHFESH